MNLIINHSSMQPIYEQIIGQIKEKIMHGELQEEEGFVNTVHGKGSFVACANQQMLLEEKRKEVEAELERAIRKGRSCGMNRDELRELFQIILEDE